MEFISISSIECRMSAKVPWSPSYSTILILGVACTDTIFGPECGPCPDGWVGDGTKDNCTETCQTDPCFPGVECLDGPVGPICGLCPAGYQGNGAECIDIDEVGHLLEKADHYALSETQFTLPFLSEITQSPLQLR